MVDEMRDVARRVAEIQMRSIEEYARAAAARGFNLAASPLAMGEVTEDDGQPRPVMTVKQDLCMIRPGVDAPAGWTVYNLAPVHVALQATSRAAREIARIFGGRDRCDQCGGAGTDTRARACHWCEGRGYRL